MILGLQVAAFLESFWPTRRRLATALFLLADCFWSYRSSSDMSQLGRMTTRGGALSAFVFLRVPDFKIDIVRVF